MAAGGSSFPHPRPVVLGGGGGAGTRNSTDPGSAGAAGGGIVIIRVGAMVHSHNPANGSVATNVLQTTLVAGWRGWQLRVSLGHRRAAASLYRHIAAGWKRME
jgi:hypothetical protein